MLAQASIFLVTAIGELFTLALLLRFLLQWLRAPARNPLSLFLMALTDFVVRPARRVVPGWAGLDLATLTLAWATQVIQIWVVLAIRGYGTESAMDVAWLAVAGLAVVQLAKLTIYVLMAALIAQAVLSWVAPYSEFARVLNNVTRPLLKPLQKIIPLVANVDLSPLVALLACQLLLILPVAWMEISLLRLL